MPSSVRIAILSCTLALATVVGFPSNLPPSFAAEPPLTRIAFGSCADQTKPCPIWGTIADYRPGLLILLGDNIYADLVDGKLTPATPERIRAAYEQLGNLPDFQRLRAEVPIMATWDDHDYGNNDAGEEWVHKDIAAKAFHDFFGTPQDSPLRSQPGIYTARVFGPPGKRVQVILLDTRYFRSELERATEPLPGFRALPYVPAIGPDKTMLGEAQWEWLEQQLREPAELRLLGSSIQLLSNDHPFEKWGNFPDERRRLLELIRRSEASGVVVLSGDRHLGELSLDPNAVGYPLYDLTASGLNQAYPNWRGLEPNRLRVAALPYGNHFGAIEIDWDAEDPVVALQLRHEDGEIAVQARVPLSRLRAPEPLPELADEPLPDGVIGPARALRLPAGQTVEIQFLVRGSHVVGDREKILLNSESDFRDIRNFTLVIDRTALTGPWATVDANELVGRTIRAKGQLSLYREANQLVVESADQLELLSAE